MNPPLASQRSPKTCCKAIGKKDGTNLRICMSEWQPIESAPKDDVEFLGWDGNILDKTWAGWTGADDKPIYVREDWRSWNPTHWMPLPEPPKDICL